MPTRLVELHEDPRTGSLTLQNVDPPPAPRGKRVRGLAVVLGVLAVIAIAEYAVAVHLIRSGSFHARIDIRNGTARVQHGLLRRRVALQRVTEVVLTRHVQHGRVVTEARRGAHMFHTYRLELHGSDTGPFALLPALTTPFEDRQRALFNALHSFSISLASELARTHRYVETEEAAPG